MKMKRTILSNVLSVFFISSAISCMPINATELDEKPGTAGAEAAAPQQETLVVAQAAAPAPVPAPAMTMPTGKQITPGGAALYEETPPLLTVTQCGQCHTNVFNKLQKDGAGHRIYCQDCHEQFHSYSPVKNNWNEIMPKCSQCHIEPHGPKFPNCLTCHSNPHTPLNVQLNATLSAECGNCHTGPSGELMANPSKHTTVACTDCHHTKHGTIPSCMECHQPHVPDQPLEACKSCHPVHKPLQISYSAGTEDTCGSCHTAVYKTWTASPSKHSGVACADCHEQHGQIPQCTKCHEQPHDPKMLEKFPRCLDCHIDAHNPPVNK